MLGLEGLSALLQALPAVREDQARIIALLEQSIALQARIAAAVERTSPRGCGDDAR